MKRRKSSMSSRVMSSAFRENSILVERLVIFLQIERILAAWWKVTP